jgi:F0F1-type ATP synthase assembly protein I
MASLEKPQSRKTRKLKNLDPFARYSSLAFEMVIIILAGVFGGIKLDAILGCKPLFTAILSLAAVIIAIYFAIKDFLRISKNEK